MALGEPVAAGKVFGRLTVGVVLQMLDGGRAIAIVEGEALDVGVVRSVARVSEGGERVEEEATEREEEGGS